MTLDGLSWVYMRQVDLGCLWIEGQPLFDPPDNFDLFLNWIRKLQVAAYVAGQSDSISKTYIQHKSTHLT